MTLDELVRAYRDAEPNRAMGGIRALGGFDFQVRVHLAAFVEGLASGSATDAGAEFVGAFETLTDSTRSDSTDNLVLMQIKRTLTRQTFASAAVEFAHIDQFLTDRGMQLQPNYEVVCEKSDDASLPTPADLTLPSREVDRSPWIVERWEAILAAGRFVGLRTEPDPWWRLICAASPVINEPFEFARRALDLCLNQGTESTSAKWVRDQIAEQFLSARRSTSASVQTLRKSDFAPIDTAVPVTVGKTASVEMLRQRQYMPRRRHTEAVCHEVVSHLSTRDRRVAHTLDVVWIAGKSGSGKSVLLLQVMEEMVNRGHRCAWLKGNTRELYPLLNSCAASAAPGEPSDLEVVFIDDLYDPLQQDSLRLSETAELVAHNRSFSWPVVVTCGPPEIETEFDREFGRDAIEVLRWTLPPVDSEESQQLLEWFQQRTGRPGFPRRAFEQEQMLMVSLAIELQHGDLATLARNFRNRLSVSQLDNCLRVPLALNRLYIWTPVEWLTDREWERLDAFNQEDDFSVIHSEARDQRFIRLTHPHISEVIYQTVRTPNSPLAFASDLSDAFAKCLPDHILTGRNLIRVFASGHERLRNVDEDRLVQSCATAWSGAADEIDASHGKHAADIWVAWAEWNARCPDLRIDDRLGQSSVDAARGRLLNAGVFRTVLWQRLLQSYPEYGPLVVDGITLMSDGVVQSSPAWSYVWESLLDVRNSGREFPNVDLLAAATGWMEGREDNAGWPFVVQRVLRADTDAHPETRRQILTSIWHWLDGRESHASWQFLWEHLADSVERPDGLNVEQIDSLGLMWLRSQAEHPSWNYVWQKLASREQTDLNETGLAGLALDWLPDHLDSNGWSFVWQGLIRNAALSDSERDAVYALGFEWLTGHEDSPDWNFVLQELLANLSSTTVLPQAEVCNRGLQWLAAHYSDKAWSYVWKTMVDVQETQPELSALEVARLGTDWLFKSLNREEFTHVAAALLEFAPTVPDFNGTPEVQQCALNWLTNRRNWDVQGWLQVLESLIDSGFRVARLDHSLASALIRRAERPQWARIASKLLCAVDAPASGDGVAQALASWLREHAGRLFDIVWLDEYIKANPECQSHELGGWASLRELLAQRRHSLEALKTRKQNGESVIGTVVRQEMGDFVIDVGVPAVCRASQISDEPVPVSEVLVGQQLEFAIVRLDPKHGRVELSRRKWLDRIRTRTLEQCKRGDVVDVEIRHLADHAAFADLSGVSVRIKLRQLSWQQINHPSDVLAVDDSVRVKVTEVSKKAKRIDASLREVGETPWDGLDESLPVGSSAEGTVVSVTAERAIIALDNGVTGFARVQNIANADWVGDASLFLAEGQRVSVRVLKVDGRKRRLLLAVD